MIANSIVNIAHDICCGCMMCGDICASHAIAFKVSDGFWYPSVDVDKCTNCGLCSKKCPVLYEVSVTAQYPLSCYGAKTKDEAVRIESTSGGVFTEIATLWIHEGGVCVGAEYIDDQKIAHRMEHGKEGISRLRQSKYAQSYMGGIYKEVKKQLVSGIPVMFCGTPCQVGALKSFLSKKYDNLFTIDFVCLGICSPVVYRKYLDMLERKYASKVKKVWFKNKRHGWRSVGTLVEFENGKEYYRRAPYDLYMRSFIFDFLSLRPNCEHCKFRKIPHCSDLTLGDFWGVEKLNPKIDDNMGLSAVMANTEKGKMWVERILNNTVSMITTADEIVAGNFSAIRSAKVNEHSKDFLTYIMDHTFEESMNKYGSYKGFNKYRMEWQLIKQNLKSLFDKNGKSKF